MYEGAGVVSIKKLIKNLITMLRKPDIETANIAEDKPDIYEFIKEYFNDIIKNDLK